MTHDIDLDALTAAIEAGSQALIAAANLTEGATDGDDTCLKDEETCFRIHPVHFAWYQLGDTGVVGETKAIARVAVEAAHKPLLSALTATRAELETALNLLYGTALYQHHAQCGEASQWDIRRCEDAHCLERAHLLEQHGLLPKEWGAYLAPAAAPQPDEDEPFDCAPECRCGKGAGAGDGEQDTATCGNTYAFSWDGDTLWLECDPCKERNGEWIVCSAEPGDTWGELVQAVANHEAAFHASTASEQDTATCGNTYIGNVGEFTCTLYAPHDGDRWNSLAEFGWAADAASVQGAADGEAQA